jgi:hypothetical protein
MENKQIVYLYKIYSYLSIPEIIYNDSYLDNIKFSKIKENEKKVDDNLYPTLIILFIISIICLFLLFLLEYRLDIY